MPSSQKRRWFFSGWLGKRFISDSTIQPCFPTITRLAVYALLPEQFKGVQDLRMALAQFNSATVKKWATSEFFEAHERDRRVNHGWGREFSTSAPLCDQAILNSRNRRGPFWAIHSFSSLDTVWLTHTTAVKPRQHKQPLLVSFGGAGRGNNETS